MAIVPVASVTVSPTAPNMYVGGTVQLTATLKDASGNVLSGRALTWTTGNGAVGTVSASGLVTGVAVGAVTITATSEGQAGTAAVTVSSVPVASVTVSPATANVFVGATTQLSAVTKDAAGSVLSGRVISWTSSNTAIATVSAAGLVTGVAAGSAMITATSEGKSGTASVTVAIVPVASVTVSPATAVVLVGATVQLTTTLKDAAGNVLSGRSVTWASGTPAVATVSSTGLVTGVAASAATITATSEGQRGTAAVTVNLVPVASVTVSPASASIRVGQLVQLTATLKDASGTVLSGRVISWVSSAPGVAAVSTGGLVTGVAAGAATITATSEGQSGTTQVSVTASAPGQVIYYSTNFNDGTTGPLDVYAYGGGSCAASTAYVDPGSAHSMKCTIPAPGGAAALQTWFGTSKLVGTPNDPSLDQDLFEQVRFVLAPGAAAAIGGTTCGSSNSGSQFKTHKSVYGQSGSAINGWVMSEISPCSDGNIGMFSEAEMWRNNGHANPWPGTYPSLNEGTVYDVVYRYHRYTAQGCGTVAVWVNGTKVMDLACASYMGTTGGSSAGLLFWDGATYLSGGLGPLTVYTLFVQATNYPIGAATPSP